MKSFPVPNDATEVAEPGDIALVHCNESFIFAPGHRLRTAQCLICRHLIGGRPTAIIGAAALAGEPCPCGGIVSDVFLIHKDHLPLSPTALQTALQRGLQCGDPHE